MSSRLSPTSDLQTYPDIIMTVHARQSREGAGSDKAFDPHDLDAEPIGPLLAVMVATGERPSPSDRTLLTVGGWHFDVPPQTEHIACVTPPDKWGTLELVELRVHGFELVGELSDLAGTENAPALRAGASRLTTWGKLRDVADILADDKRGVRFQVDAAQRLVMDWWHVSKSAVFYEIDIYRKKGPRPFVRTLCPLGAGPTDLRDPGWYQAQRTVFEPLTD